MKIRLLSFLGRQPFVQGDLSMKRIVMCREMKQLDEQTIKGMGVPSCVLMERAALKTCEMLEKELSGRKKEEKILCICGGGNNGGDGIAIARILKLHGFDASFCMVGNPAHCTEENLRQQKIAASYRVCRDDSLNFASYTMLVDALFGVGLTRDVSGVYADVIEKINCSDAFKAAVDIPSGINGDTGQIMGIAVKADLTVTFAYAKAGLILYPGRIFAGKTITADVGIYGRTDDVWKQVSLDKKDVQALPMRDPAGNKGTFGKVLAVTGSAGMGGAAYLSAAAALAAGAGMVRILTAEENRIPLQTLLPEAIFTVDEKENFKDAYAWSDVLVIGSGLGKSPAAKEKAAWFLRQAAADRKPLVLDADGLNLLAENPDWMAYLGEHVILTPHMGEMSRLTGKSIGELAANRVAAASLYASETNSVCVMKDACTVTAAPDGRIYLNQSGNAGMATAGSGDVLGGVLAGTLCRYQHASKDVSLGYQAALAVYLHGLAGDAAAEKNGVPGMKASDMLKTIPFVPLSIGIEK